MDTVESDLHVIPCLTWVKSGVSKRKPDRVQLTPGEIAAMMTNFEAPRPVEKKETDSDDVDDDETVDDATDDESHSVSSHESTESAGSGDKSSASSEDSSEENAVKERYNLNDYDDDVDKDDDDKDDENLEDADEATGTGGKTLTQLACFASSADDPYLTKAGLDGVSDDSEEEQDLEILPDDRLIVTAKVKSEEYTLAIFVYNEKQDAMFCHHDIILPSFPLAMEWIGYDPGEQGQGNLLAIGCMTPDIEIWDLDVINTIEPAFVLAGASVKKGKKKKKISMAGHTDAVLDLAWNSQHEHVLASASADFTVGLWDLEEGKLVTSLCQHTDKVQTIQWHPYEKQTLLSGSFDQTVKLYDCRSPNDANKTWSLPGEVETVLWNTSNPYYFFVSTDTGHVYCLDVRTDTPVCSKHCHKGSVTGLGLSSKIPGCLVTSSTDKLCKVWDVRSDKFVLVAEKCPKVGQINCLSSCPDLDLVFAVGGEREFRVVDFSKQETVQQHFANAKENKSSSEAKTEEVNQSTDESGTELSLSVGVDKKKRKKKPKKKNKK